MRYFCLLIFVISHAFGSDYVKPEHISKEIWETVLPYFLPVNHPAKKVLDKIFGGKIRVLADSQSIALAGFSNGMPGKYSKTIVTTHKKLPGYYIKMFADNQPGMLDWAKFVDRVRGANKVHCVIDKYDLAPYFKVPCKWIYPLPVNPAPEEGKHRKNFILIAQDMDLITPEKNLKKWKSSKLPKKVLNVVYLLLKKAGLKDSVYAFNLPFAKDGKIAIIDTEYYNLKGIRYLTLCQYLSKGNQQYWKDLVSHGGSLGKARIHEEPYFE